MGDENVKHMKIYDAEPDALLASQNRDPLLRHLTHVIVDLVQSHAPPGAAVLDVGCGVGRTSLALARNGYTVRGVDPGAQVIQLATAAARDAGLAHAARFEVGDATASPPDEHVGAYDAVVCSEVIEHVVDPASVLDYCRRALRPSGVLILTTPHDRRQWTAMDDYAGHVTRFTVPELEGLLRGGFQDVSVTTEGFPFQRTVMQAYNAMLGKSGRSHEFGAFRDSLPYRAYVAFMPSLLAVDHWFRRLRRGTTLVAVARRR